MAFGLYLHFPFCRNLCSYCDYYKNLYDARLEKEFFEALAIETELVAEDYAELDNQISTIFVGGGTPSMANLDMFSTWLDQLRSLFYVSPDVEFSFENNPDSVTLERMQTMASLGINRPTFGIQSFVPSLLELLNRKHNPNDSYRAVYLAGALGFDNFGVDLIFGLPKQTTKMLSADLDQLIDLNPPHISFYQLTIEPGTTLERRVASGSLSVPSSDEMFALYKGGVERLAEAGYNRYEVSSFAKEGKECRHNLGYWEGKDYLGLGPSAHSYMHGRRFSNSADVLKYSKTLLSGQRPIVPDESGHESRMNEAIMLGLRTSKGIDRRHFAERFGVAVEERLVRKQYDVFVESGHLIPDKGWLRLSDDGILQAEEITSRLIK